MEEVYINMESEAEDDEEEKVDPLEEKSDDGSGEVESEGAKEEEVDPLEEEEGGGGKWESEQEVEVKMEPLEDSPVRTEDINTNPKLLRDRSQVNPITELYDVMWSVKVEEEPRRKCGAADGDCFYSSDDLHSIGDTDSSFDDDYEVTRETPRQSEDIEVMRDISTRQQNKNDSVRKYGRRSECGKGEERCAKRRRCDTADTSLGPFPHASTTQDNTSPGPHPSITTVQGNASPIPCPTATITQGNASNGTISPTSTTQGNTSNGTLPPTSTTQDPEDPPPDPVVLPSEGDDWQWPLYSPQLHAFDDSLSGVSDAAALTNNCREIDVFLKYFDESLVKNITERTNAHHDSVTARRRKEEKAGCRSWSPVTEREVYLLLALTMLMGHHKKHNLQDYWTCNSIFQLPEFHKIMPQQRFFSILKWFNIKEENSKANIFGFLKLVLTHLHDTFSSMFYPYKKMAIDKREVKWKPVSTTRQSIPLKVHKTIICLLRDCKTGYVLNVMLFSRSFNVSQDIAPNGISGLMVDYMVQKYFDRGHHLYLDHYYTSPLQFQYLRECLVGACGPVKAIKNDMPNLPKPKRGVCVSEESDGLISVRWHGKSDVTLLSTLHINKQDATSRNSQAGQSVMKPTILVDYTTNMRPLDQNNMMISSVDSLQESVAWYKQCFFYLVDLTVLNSYYVFQIKSGRKLHLHEFSWKLIEQILERFMKPQESTGRG